MAKNLKHSALVHRNESGKASITLILSPAPAIFREGQTRNIRKPLVVGKSASFSRLTDGIKHPVTIRKIGE